VKAAALSALLLAGCVLEPRVVRVYDGRLVEGPYVPPEAYAAYLRGVLAEESGDLATALSAYESASREDEEDVEPVTRVGDLRCRIDPKSAAADEAFARATKIDSAYAPLVEARARCAAARGKPLEASAIVAKLPAEDRTSASLEAFSIALASADPRAHRDRAIALTLANDTPLAWEALVTWGRAKNDAFLMQRGWVQLARFLPARQDELQDGVLELLGRGEAFLARELAGAILDRGSLRRGAASSSREAATASGNETVARLALDEAILRDDEEILDRRATRAHVDIAEVAARALLLERAPFARRLADRVLAADPSSSCAAMVASAERARAARGTGRAGPRGAVWRTTDRPSAACALVVAERIGASTVEAARLWLAQADMSPLLAHDPVVGPLAVDLAARGAMPESALPLELRLELAARRREAPPPADAALVDAKHLLLWHVLVDPTGAPAVMLATKLAGAAERDPVIGLASARIALATASDGATKARRIIASSPSDPLLLALGVELAKRGGKPDEIPPARARLAAVARTAAERALLTE
jgi:hypothetical protein